MNKITVPNNAVGATVLYAYVDEIESDEIEVREAYISFGDYNEETDRCALTGIPDHNIFFYASASEFPKLFEEDNGEDFMLFGEPDYNFDSLAKGREKALQDIPMECIVMLHLPDNVLGKFYGTFADGGEAFDFITNSIESQGNFAMFPLRNPEKRRSYHEWWLPEFVDSITIPSDEFKYPNKEKQQ